MITVQLTVFDVFENHAMARFANILITCTKRKRAPIAKSQHLRRVPRSEPRGVAEVWTKKLSAAEGTKVQATELYAGDHWRVASGLQNSADHHGIDSKLWVVSAGYGLIPGTASIHPYSATFSSNDPDEVLGRFKNIEPAEALKQWWKALSRWKGPSPREPRSIKNLVSIDPKSPLLVVSSPKYLNAIEDDLLAARSVMAKPNLLIIASAGCSKTSPLADNVLNFSGDLQHTLGGALMSLNARVARAAIERNQKWPWTVRSFQEAVDSIPLPHGIDLGPPKRQPTTDEEVKKFVRKAFRSRQEPRHSSLLRDYRDQGYACEQKRFRRLFQEVERNYAAKK